MRENSTRVQQNRFKTLYGPMPIVMLNNGQTMYEKSVTEMFYPLVNFDAPGGPLGPKFTSLETDIQPNLSMFQISSGADNLCTVKIRI